MTVTDSTIEGNSAGSGGGIFTAGWMVVTNSLIANNQAASGGGGIYNASEMFLTSSTVAGNQAGVGGGGGFEHNSIGFFNGRTPFPDETFVTDCTIADNRSGGGGGGIDVISGVIGVTNCIIAGNTDSNGANDIAGGGVSSASAYNLVGADETGSLTTANHNLLNVGNPGLGPLANNAARPKPWPCCPTARPSALEASPWPSTHGRDYC